MYVFVCLSNIQQKIGVHRLSHESVYLVNNRDAEETRDIQNILNKNKPNCAEMRVFQIIFIF